MTTFSKPFGQLHSVHFEHVKVTVTLLKLYQEILFKTESYIMLCDKALDCDKENKTHSKQCPY